MSNKNYKLVVPQVVKTMSWSKYQRFFIERLFLRPVSTPAVFVLSLAFPKNDEKRRRDRAKRLNEWTQTMEIRLAVFVVKTRKTRGDTFIDAERRVWYCALRVETITYPFVMVEARMASRVWNMLRLGDTVKCVYALQYSRGGFVTALQKIAKRLENVPRSPPYWKRGRSRRLEDLATELSTKEFFNKIDASLQRWNVKVSKEFYFLNCSSKGLERWIANGLGPFSEWMPELRPVLWMNVSFGGGSKLV